jgi:hypothetical protein
VLRGGNPFEDDPPLDEGTSALSNPFDEDDDWEA